MDTLTKKEEAIKRVTVTMPCQFGLNVKMATQFIYLARQFSSKILIQKGKFIADGKSILSLLTLGAFWQSKLHIEVKGDDADEAIKAIENYFNDSSHCYDEA